LRSPSSDSQSDFSISAFFRFIWLPDGAARIGFIRALGSYVMDFVRRHSFSRLAASAGLFDFRLGSLCSRSCPYSVCTVDHIISAGHVYPPCCGFVLPQVNATCSLCFQWVLMFRNGVRSDPFYLNPFWILERPVRGLRYRLRFVPPFFFVYFFVLFYSFPL